MKNTEFRKMAIERIDQRCRFLLVDAEHSAASEDQAFLFEAQVHRIGGYPVGPSCVVLRRREFAQKSHRGAGEFGRVAEQFQERCLSRLRRTRRGAPASEQQGKRRTVETVPDVTVFGVGPE